MASTYVSTSARHQAPAAAPAAAPQPDDSEGLHRALRAERQARKDAETRLNRLRQEVAAEIQPLRDKLHRFEGMLQRIAETQLDQMEQLRQAREQSALFSRRV